MCGHIHLDWKGTFLLSLSPLKHLHLLVKLAKFVSLLLMGYKHMRHIAHIEGHIELCPLCEAYVFLCV